MNNIKVKQGGFTLLELLVFIVIIGLLMGYVGSKYFNQSGKSERKVAVVQINAFESALDCFGLDVRRYPITTVVLNVLLITPGYMPRWIGPLPQKRKALRPMAKP